MAVEDDDSDATIVRPPRRPAAPIEAAPAPAEFTPETAVEAAPEASDAAELLESILQTPVAADAAETFPETAEVPAAPEPPVPPMRYSVLAGAFFGAAHSEIAARLASMIAGETPAFTAWFGSEGASLATEPARLLALLNRDIAAIDAMIAGQLDVILHHPRLRRLEGSWRGLTWLSSRIGFTGRVKLRVMQVSWAEICRDLERAAEFDQSQLFRSIYEDEFGIAGGEPYGLLVMDHEVRHQPAAGAMTDDISALTSLAGVAAAAFAPMIIGAAPALLGVDEFAELSGVGDPASHMGAAEYRRWKRLASLEDGRFLAIGLPRTVARLPWEEQLDRHRGFRYRETISKPSDRVVSCAGYLVAACVVRAFEEYSWPADIRGYDIDRLGGGVIEDLPELVFSCDPADGFARPAPELILTDRQERALVAAGLLPIGTLPFGGEALVGAARSLQSPAVRYAGAGASAAAANAQLSAQLNSMICVSRFAHYIKIMGRDMVGSFRGAADIQRALEDWLTKFATSNTTAGPETMARYPLRSAAVTVQEVTGKPGVFGCIVHLQPHFQLDDVSASFRLMTELSAPGKQ